MRKVLVAVLVLYFLAVGLQAAPLLVEAYQEGQISIPVGQDDTTKVVELSFSVDTSCYVQFTVGCRARYARLWLELDGDSLPPGAVAITNQTVKESLCFVYTYLLDAGNHVITLEVANYYNGPSATICTDSYLQALIFLPDTATGAIAEQPAGDVEPTEGMTSVISRGPYVTVTGATELVDASGRVIENAITDDKVSINALPQGTYFARDDERTVVKIVKVQ